MKKNKLLILIRLFGALICAVIIISFINLSLSKKDTLLSEQTILCDKQKSLNSEDIINSRKTEVVVCFSDTYIVAKTAIGARQHARGLSGREFLNDGEGMLFVFETSDRYGFWMKDMNFPIDIIWADEDGNIVYIKENATPDSYPEVFEPDVYSRFVLEVNSGFVKEKGINIGTRLNIY